MSSPIGWCVHASATSTRSPGRSRSMAIAPSTNWLRSPFCRAKRIENEVIFTPGGVSAGDLQKRLRIGHHQGRRAVEPVQGVAQLPLLDDHAVGVAVQQVADRLHLRQDQPALGGLHVDRHDQHGQLARRHQVGHDRRAC